MNDKDEPIQYVRVPLKPKRAPIGVSLLPLVDTDLLAWAAMLPRGDGKRQPGRGHVIAEMRRVLKAVGWAPGLDVVLAKRKGRTPVSTPHARLTPSKASN
jgi:hypothetical protein